ncbi:MAG: DUF5777 family beta-barrel protein [Anditalea sp.]
MKHFLLGALCFIGIVFSVSGQDDLLKQLEKEAEPIEDKTAGTFKGTRLINGHSVEVREKGTLDFLISHRFGRINSGAYSLFGLDESNIRFGLEYAFIDRFTLGVGRNSFMKVYDGFFKYKILQQSGQQKVPISLVWFSGAAANTLKRPELLMNFERRLGFTHQALISRKFNESLSLQLAPSYIHRNLVSSSMEENGLYALGLGGRYKITPGTSLNLEYFYRFGDQTKNTFNALAIGFDIETGGHVFQLHLTNAQSMTETGFIPATTGDFFGGDIHFGFNISRTFQLKEKEEGW